MHEPAHPPSLEPPFKTGQVIAGVSLTVVWVILHVVLFYLLAASGIIFVAFLESILTFLFPGRSLNNPMGSLDWILPLQVGLTLGGIAGIPAGLAIFGALGANSSGHSSASPSSVRSSSRFILSSDFSQILSVLSKGAVHWLPAEPMGYAKPVVFYKCVN